MFLARNYKTRGHRPPLQGTSGLFMLTSSASVRCSGGKAMRLRIGLAVLAAAFLALAVLPSRAADTLPAKLSDGAYWKMISDFSEPGGLFQLEIITSNEMSYQYAMPQLMNAVKPGGVYLGVAPEQNFTYIAALQPKIAFIFDIRRDMMLEHLMYKSVFETSANRVEFVANLFSRKAPA